MKKKKIELITIPTPVKKSKTNKYTYCQHLKEKIANNNTSTHGKFK